MTETKKKLDELTSKLHQIRRELRRLPERKEQFEAVFNEMRAEWPAMLAKQAIGEIQEPQVEEYRRELAVADRNWREISELEAGLLSLERQTISQMRPLQKKLRLEQAKARYAELAEKLEAGGYNRHLAQDFRMVAHEIGKDHECSELLRRIEHVRNREMTFSEIYGGLRPEGV